MEKVRRIGIFTGGGDVPGLNTAIRDLTVRAYKEGGHEVIGIRRGWGGLVYRDPSSKEVNDDHTVELNPENVRNVHRTGGTFLHTSRTNPLKVEHHRDLEIFRRIQPFDGERDMTDDVMANLESLRIDALVVIGGDDTLSYARYLNEKFRFPIVAIPKTMDNDVAGTDYCIGFATAVERARALLTDFRTPLSSHERIGVVRIFGRHSGFTALYSSLAAKCDRVLIPEVPYDINLVTDLILSDREKNPSRYALLLVAEGVHPHDGEIVYQEDKKDPYGHKKLGGIEKAIAKHLREKTGVDTMDEELTYHIRGGDPGAKDIITASYFANLAFELLNAGQSGRMVAIRNGVFTHVPLEETAASPTTVDVGRFYNLGRYRPQYAHLMGAVSRL